MQQSVSSVAIVNVFLFCRMRVSMGLNPLTAASSTTTREAKEVAAGKARVQERESKASSAAARDRISRFDPRTSARAGCKN